MTSPESANNRLGIHILSSFGVGGVVSVLAILAAWLAHGPRIPLAISDTRDTEETMRYVAGEISRYSRKIGRLPESLDQLFKVTDPEGTNRQGFDDGWRHPLVYEVQGQEYSLTSLGRDGRVGGRGFDCDLTFGGPPPAAALPTLEQFVLEGDGSVMIIGCLGCGVLAALTALVTLRAPDFSRAGMVSLTVKLALVTIAATILATFLSALVLPGGGH